MLQNTVTRVVGFLLLRLKRCRHKLKIVSAGLVLVSLNMEACFVRGVCVSDNKNNDLVVVPPKCFACCLQNSNNCHKVVNCQRFWRMTPLNKRKLSLKHVAALIFWKTTL